MTTDEKYMSRCLQLGRNGFYGAAPNPMVGAVIVHEGRIIGEGYHIRCGGPHAEVNAVRSVSRPELLKESTIYVSLEPCSHYGKTPPCADLIIEKGISRVVVGCRDPFAKVAGRGIRKLQDAGIDVTVGVLEEECRALNRRFITFHTHRRPYITLKWAESADGFIDTLRADFQKETPYVYSTPYTRMLVHRCRAEHQAVLVGRRTALADNPLLTDRLWIGRSPLRLVMDREGTLPAGLKLFCEGGATRVYTDISAPGPACETHPGVTVVRLDFSRDVIPQILDDLYALSVQTLLVEGGRQVLESFIAGGFWDEIRVEQSGVCLGEGVPAPDKPRGRMEVTEVDGHRLIHIDSPQSGFAG
ncbi:MAG: bifunctional diaminohydroxyphosphoribosylaminopyrimidine deaminase/5-amino-6-(5-phosphoribosylamino)uracil reductase RibD [Paraprevotella sp.]|nr:bifunctional diaminohydroxyphosphoribosylaminopyrimidine deaminase/5-amino-6-(5-phosphoribosylamino)uracil reductase RibD [Paraprevotella sp.]